MLNHKALLGGMLTCQLERTTKFTATDATWGYPDWDQENADLTDMHSLTTNKDRITIKHPGNYLIIFNYYTASNSTGVRTAGILINGISRNQNNQVSTFNSGGTLTLMRVLATDDYITARVWQNSGGDLDYGTTSFYLTAIYVGGI